MGQHRTEHEDLARTLVAGIVEGAGRRVRGLVVAHCDDRLIVRGAAESYHVWQLAIAACQECLSKRPEVGLACRFRVTGMSSRAESLSHVPRAVASLA